MMQLSVRLVPVNDTTLVIALTGELDSTTRPVLAAFLDPLPRSSVKYVLVAAGDLWFCDLHGLEQLAITHRALRAKGGHLGVAEAQPPLRRLITLMSEQAHATLPMFASMPEALAAAGVEAYRTEAPPALSLRHLPNLRVLPHAPAIVRDRPRTRPADPPASQPPDNVETQETATPPPFSPLPYLGALPPIISQSRALRMQLVYQQEQLAQRLAAATRARSLLQTARDRCEDTLGALRANLDSARSAMRPEGTALGKPKHP